jgi:hypothetical protein
MGIKRENVVVWTGNGIEFVYPRKILEQRFGRAEVVIVDDDRVAIGDHTMTKQELNQLVVTVLRGDEAPPEELTNKLMGPLEALLRT